MRIGINGSSLIALGQPSAAIVDHAVAAEADGFSSYWLAQLAVPDALTVIGAIGPRTTTITLGTAVIPTWPRHPLMLAGQAMTASELCDGRLVLGIGLAHKPTIETTFKVPFARPAKHMDEYLTVMLGAMHDRKVAFTGEIWSGEVDNVGGNAAAPVPSVMLAAMGPRMLELAGGRVDGTILWLSGPRTIESEIGPAVRAAALAAGRSEPRVVASVPVCVTDDPDTVKRFVAGMLVGYNDLPSYRRVMDVEGAAGPADVSLVGDEATVRAGLDRFRDAGTTDFAALEFTLDEEAATRTRALLKDYDPR